MIVIEELDNIYLKIICISFGMFALLAALIPFLTQLYRWHVSFPKTSPEHKSNDSCIGILTRLSVVLVR